MTWPATIGKGAERSIMSSQRWISVVAALAAWACIGADLADAGVISPVGGGGAVTLSIFKQASPVYEDITDTYLPTWSPGATLQTVYIVVTGLPDAPSLVEDFPTATVSNPFLADKVTSRFTGNCSNRGDVTGLDFSLGAGVTIPTPAGNKTGYPLTANDCGGMAVIKVGASADKYIVPKDADAAGNPTGIPNALNVFGVALTPEGDPDGDGLSTFDETVRGFIVGGQHLRFNPTVKNLLVYLVRGQCGTSLLTASGGFPVADAGPLDANLNTLIPSPTSPPPGIANTQIHFLGNSLSPSTTAIRTDEWVDHFVSFTLGSGGTTETWTYCSSSLAPCPAAAGTVVVTAASETPAAPTTDRVVNTNRVYGNAMKGLRLTECATTSGTSPHGTGRYGSAAQGKDEGVIYPDRIRRFVNSKGTRTANIYYSTFQITDPVAGTGAWTALSLVGGGTTAATAAARNIITSRVIQYILAMEIGHTLKLIGEDLLLTVATFPHYVAGYGDNMDEALQVVTTGTPSGPKYYIPSIFLGASQGGFTLTEPVQ